MNTFTGRRILFWVTDFPFSLPQFEILAPFWPRNFLQKINWPYEGSLVTTFFVFLLLPLELSLQVFLQLVCFGVGLFIFVWDTLILIPGYLYSFRFGRFSAIISLNIFLILSASPSSSGISILHRFTHLYIIPPISYVAFIFFLFVFCLVLWWSISIILSSRSLIYSSVT